MTPAESDVTTNQNPSTIADLTETVFENSKKSVSIMSDSFFSNSFQKVKKLETEFIYNYFVKNEKEFNTSELGKDVIIRSGLGEEYDADYIIAQSEKYPRGVLLNFSKPSFDNGIHPITDVEKNLIENFDPNKIYSSDKDLNPIKSTFSFLLSDKNSQIDIQEKIKLSAILLDNNYDENMSYQDVAKSLYDILNNPDGVTGINKRVLLEKINNTRAKNLSVTNNKKNNNANIVTNNLHINRLFADNIFKFSSNVNGGIYEEEINSLVNKTLNIKQDYLEKLNSFGGPNAINSFAHEIYAEPMHQEAFPENETNLENIIEIKAAGYLIEKYEQLENSSFVKRELIFLKNPDQTQYFDSNVRYEGKYIYRVKAVYLCRFPMISLSDVDATLNQLIVGKILVSSNPVENKIFCEETIPPLPPGKVNARLDFKIKKPVITWQLPINKQRDIKRFQVFKRASENLPFVLIAEYNFDNSTNPITPNELAMSKNLYNLSPKLPRLYHIDTTFNINQKPIYAIASVDAHGYTSNLSTQIKIEYLKYENRLKTNIFSKEGAPKQYPNLYMNHDTFLDNIKTSGANRMIVFFDPEYYRVFKYQENQEETSTSENDAANEIDLKHIAVDPNEDTYKIHIINLDMQKEELVNIRVQDTSNPELILGGSTFNAQRYNKNTN